MTKLAMGVLVLVALAGCKNEPLSDYEKKRDYFVLEAFQTQNLVPEPGYINWSTGCCDPQNFAYLMFEYPTPQKPKELLPHEKWPSCYEIKYSIKDPVDPRKIGPDGRPFEPQFNSDRIIFYPGEGQFNGLKHGDGYGTEMSYSEFIKKLNKK